MADEDLSDASNIANWVLAPLGLLFYIIQIFFMWKTNRSSGVSIWAYIWNIAITLAYFIFNILMIFWQGIIFNMLAILLSVVIIFLVIIIESRTSATKQQLLDYIETRCYYEGECGDFSLLSARTVRITFLPDSSLAKELGNELFYAHVSKTSKGTYRAYYAPHLAYDDRGGVNRSADHLRKQLMRPHELMPNLNRMDDTITTTSNNSTTTASATTATTTKRNHDTKKNNNDTKNNNNNNISTVDL